jgi:polysaccharide pyruvyl transferase WcaK-like protein
MLMPNPNETTTATEVRVAVINYTGDRDNWGCRATSRELIGLLERSMPENTTVKPVYVPLLGRRRVDKWVERILGRSVLRALASRQPSRAEMAVLNLACRACYREFLPEVRGCQFAFFQAEGTMTGEEYCTGARLLLLPHVAKMMFGIPLISINQTVYASEPLFEPVLQAAYQQHDQIYVREPASLHFLHGLGVEQAALLPDTAFLTQPTAEDARNLIEPAPSGPYFCVSGSALFMDPNFAFDGIAELISHVHQQWQLAPVMLCSTDADRKFLKFLDRWPGRQFPIHHVPLERSHQQVARVLSDAEFLISGRYHMSILSAVAATPVVMLATNTFKHHGLAELLRYPLPVREYSEMEAVRSDLAHVRANRQELSDHLASRTREILAMISHGESQLRARLAA